MLPLCFLGFSYCSWEEEQAGGEGEGGVVGVVVGGVGVGVNVGDEKVVVAVVPTAAVGITAAADHKEVECAHGAEDGSRPVSGSTMASAGLPPLRRQLGLALASALAALCERKTTMAQTATATTTSTASVGTVPPPPPAPATSPGGVASAPVAAASIVTTATATIIRHGSASGWCWTEEALVVLGAPVVGLHRPELRRPQLVSPAFRRDSTHPRLTRTIALVVFLRVSVTKWFDDFFFKGLLEGGLAWWWWWRGGGGGERQL